MEFLDWWRGLSPWIRFPVALSIFTVSMIGLTTIQFGYGRFCGFGMAIGFILLVIGPSKADH